MLRLVSQELAHISDVLTASIVAPMMKAVSTSETSAIFYP
jgi:hypothetical protein